MKRILPIILILLVTGCTKATTLECTLDNASFEKGTMDIKIIFSLDEEQNVLNSKKTQYIYFDSTEELNSFYEEYKDNTTVVSETEVKYEETQTIEQSITSDYIKEQLELEEYSCNYKK
jgi:ABC-type dipeptide/oligopeptide/nickel transport system ATPase subunit